MLGQAIVTINESQWTVSLATTYTELTTGLRGVALPAGTGMLFILPTAQAVSVDTTGMNFALDIIFIANNVVIDVARNIEPGYLVTEETPCDSFLEVNAGEAADVEAGDEVVITDYTIPAANDFSSIIAIVLPFVVFGFAFGLVSEITKGVIGSSSIKRLKSGSSPKLLKKVIVKCPICGEEIEVGEHDSVTRSEALRKHIEKEHRVSEHHSMWLTPEQRKELEKKSGAVAVRWAEEATKPGDIKAAERAAEYYYGKIKEALGLGHLSPQLTEQQIMKLREVLGLTADVAEVLKIHQETGYIP